MDSIFGDDSLAAVCFQLEVEYGRLQDSYGFWLIGLLLATTSSRGKYKSTGSGSSAMIMGPVCWRGMSCLGFTQSFGLVKNPGLLQLAGLKAK